MLLFRLSHSQPPARRSRVTHAQAAAHAVTGAAAAASLALCQAGCGGCSPTGCLSESDEASTELDARPAFTQPPLIEYPDAPDGGSPPLTLPPGSASEQQAGDVSVPADAAWVLTPRGQAVTFADGKEPTRTIHVSASAPAGGDGSEEAPLDNVAAAVQEATPGTAVIVHPGRYPRTWLENIQGTADAPIWIGGAQGQERPIFDDPAGGLHFSGRYFVVHDVEVTGNPTNGINIDDDGNYDDPEYTRFVILRDLRIHAIGGTGNQDCLKMSGVHDFAVLDSDISRCGGGVAKGSGIDMVGCHDGIVAGTRMAAVNGSGTQIKGGSSDILILGNRFEHAGARPVNMGGMTTFRYFRPPLSTEHDNAEAWRIEVIGNEIIGGTTALAFVGCVDCLAANNTIIDPERWVIRILQENASTGDYGFEPAHSGRVINNLIYYSAAQLKSPVNLGPDTAPETFEIAHNLWFAHDVDASGEPGDLPVAETDGVYGQDPDLRAPPIDVRICASSPAAGPGAPVPEVIATGRFGATPPIGAHAPIACE